MVQSFCIMLSLAKLAVDLSLGCHPTVGIESHLVRSSQCYDVRPYLNS